MYSYGYWLVSFNFVIRWLKFHMLIFATIIIFLHFEKCHLCKYSIYLLFILIPTWCIKGIWWNIYPFSYLLNRINIHPLPLPLPEFIILRSLHITLTFLRNFWNLYTFTWSWYSRIDILAQHWFFLLFCILSKFSSFPYMILLS
jgi:hypothetical protein